MNNLPKPKYHENFHFLISIFNIPNQGHQAKLFSRLKSVERKQSKTSLDDAMIDWMRERKARKDWAEKSSLGETYVRCKFCKEDVLVQSCYGLHSHQTTKNHGDNMEEERMRSNKTKVKLRVPKCFQEPTKRL